MAILHTQLNPRSAEFVANSEAMLKQVDALHTLLAQVQQGGGAKAQERHTSRGNRCRASASIVCSTRARPSSRSANWQRTRCMAKTCRPQG